MCEGALLWRAVWGRREGRVQQKRREWSTWRGRPCAAPRPPSSGPALLLHTQAVPRAGPALSKQAGLSAEEYHGILAQRVHP